MLKRLTRNILKRVVPYRGCSTNYPEETLDANTKCTYLPNGVRVVTEENKSPLTCISLFVNAGSRYETSYNNGVTHFIEHMAYKGFKSLPRIVLEGEIHGLGFRLNVETDREMQIFSVVVPTECTNLGLGYLYRVLCDLDLNDCSIALEKKYVCLEIMDADIDHKKTVFEYLHSSAFQGTGLGQNIIGSTRSLMRYDATMMNNFIQENYGPSKLTLSTSGGVMHNNIVENIKSSFGCLCPAGCEVDPGGSRFTCSQVMYRNDDMPAAHVAIAFEAPGYSSPDYLIMLVMKYIIGSWDRTVGRGDHQASFMSRMAATSCERYQSFYIAYKDVGLWGTYFVGKKMDLDDMIIFLQSAWMDMSITCTTKVAMRAVELAKLEVCKRYSGVINSSRDIGIQMMYTSTRKPLNMYLDQLTGVTNFRIREAALKYIYDKGPVVAAIGPTENLSEYNRIESGTYWLRW